MKIISDALIDYVFPPDDDDRGRLVRRERKLDESFTPWDWDLPEPIKKNIYIISISDLLMVS